MRTQIVITYADGQVVTVWTTPLAWMRWEQASGSTALQFTQNYSVSSHLRLAYESLRAAGAIVPASFDEWAATVADLESEVADAVDPTDPAASAD